MKCNDETVSRQNLWAGNIAKSMTSEGNSACSSWMMTDDRRYSEVYWISTFHISRAPPRETLPVPLGQVIKCLLLNL